MTGIAAFDTQELYLLWKAPYKTALAVIAAQPGGLAAEMLAAVRASLEAREMFQSELLQELLNMPQSETNSFNEKVSNEVQALGTVNADDILSMAIKDIRGALSILRLKAKAQEVQAQEVQEYQQLVLQRADRVAKAGKEGSFLGIGGVHVTEAEERVLAEIRLAVNRTN